MGLNVGTLQSTLAMNTSGFSNGIASAQTTSKQLGAELENGLAKPMDVAMESGDRLTDSLHDTARNADDLRESAKRASDSVEQLGEDGRKASTGVEQIGEKAEKSSKLVGGLKTVAGALGLTVGITALIDGLKKIGEVALKSADETTSAMRIMAVATGAQEMALANYGGIVEELVNTVGYTKEDIASTLGAVATMNRGIEDDQLKSLTAEYHSLAGLLGEDGVSVVMSADAAFKKWGISTEEQADYLKYFFRLTQDSGIGIETLTDAMTSGDRAFQLIGLSAKEAGAYISEMFHAGSIDDVNALTNSIEMLVSQKAEGLGSDKEAEKYIQDTLAQAAAIGDESAALAYLKSEMSVSERVARAFTDALYAGSIDIDKAVASADSMSESLTDVDKKFETAEQQGVRMANNVHLALEPVGESLTLIRDRVDEILQKVPEQGGLATFAELAQGYTRIASTVANPVVGIGGLIGDYAREIVINQVFNTPTVDPYELQQAAQQTSIELENSIYT